MKKLRILCDAAWQTNTNVLLRSKRSWNVKDVLNKVEFEIHISWRVQQQSVIIKKEVSKKSFNVCRWSTNEVEGWLYLTKGNFQGKETFIRDKITSQIHFERRCDVMRCFAYKHQAPLYPTRHGVVKNIKSENIFPPSSTKCSQIISVFMSSSIARSFAQHYLCDLLPLITDKQGECWDRVVFKKETHEREVNDHIKH